MHVDIQHEWNLTPRQAMSLQTELQGQVSRADSFEDVQYVAGVDVGFEQHNTITRAAVAVLNLEDLSLKDIAIARLPCEFPYIPGLLSFREIPAVLLAMNALATQPDLLLCDGQGIAHPRRLGVASHLGVITGIPSIGVAKKRLIGQYKEPENSKGAYQLLTDKEETIGAVLRTRVDVKPLFISIGHKISLETAINIVMGCITRYKLPETTRWAHRLASGSLEEIKKYMQKAQIDPSLIAKIR
jgi:deoxyribonuclease V